MPVRFDMRFHTGETAFQLHMQAPAALDAGFTPGILTGPAETARRLYTARSIALGGDAQGGALFDGSADAEIYAAVARLSNEELEEILT